MAVTEMRTIHPKMPAYGDLDWRTFRLDYDRLSDTLYLDFYGEPRAAISYPVTDHVLYSVDPETEAVVGYQIDGFLAHVVYTTPVFLDLAEQIGLSPDEVARIRAGIDPDDRTRAAMRSLFGSLAASERGLVGV